MDKKDMPLYLRREREDKIRQVERKAESVDIFRYVKFMLLPGALVAVVMFLKVGQWYDTNYGFDGSFGAALSAAGGVLLVFAILGAVIGSLVKSSVLSQIDDIEAGYDAMVHDISRDHTPIQSRFSNYAHVRGIIDKITGYMGTKIRQADRSVTRRRIQVAWVVKVTETQVEYDEGYFYFASRNLAKLVSPFDRAELAQVIAEGVAVDIRKMFPTDASGTVPEVSVVCEGDRHGTATATVFYSCENGRFEEAKPW